MVYTVFYLYRLEPQLLAGRTSKHSGPFCPNKSQYLFAILQRTATQPTPTHRAFPTVHDAPPPGPIECCDLRECGVSTRPPASQPGDTPYRSLITENASKEHLASSLPTAETPVEAGVLWPAVRGCCAPLGWWINDKLTASRTMSARTSRKFLGCLSTAIHFYKLLGSLWTPL